MTFYNPYHFIPVDGKVQADGAERAEQVTVRAYDYNRAASVPDASASAIARHDVWSADHLSGRLVVKLTTKTPTVTGNQHRATSGVDGASAEVYQYRWGERVAIAANSLRGAIASNVERLSQSTLRVMDRKYWPFFERIDHHLIPWNPRRDALTPAELILGVVDDLQVDQRDNDEVCNLASRVRFYDAWLPESVTDSPLMNEVTLLEQGNPRADANLNEIGGAPDYNCANHYFTTESDVAASHREVRNELGRPNVTLTPAGVKERLPRNRPLSEAAYRLPSTAGEADMRKSICRPIKEETVFYFHVDFDNLTDAELTLLLCALQPGDHYLHKIGLGKSMGMGQVELAVQALLLVDRQQRYSRQDALSAAGKYHKIDRCGSTSTDWQLMERYQLEANDAMHGNLQEIIFQANNTLIDTRTLKRLVKFGNEKYLKPGVTIRWRKNQHSNEPAMALPQVSTEDELLPVYGSAGATEAAVELPGKTELLPNNPVAPPAADWVEENLIDGPDEHGVKAWLREKIVKLANGKPAFTDLDSQQVCQGLTKSALFREWEKLPDRQQKTRIRDTLMKAVADSGEPNPWMSIKQAKAEKGYLGWVE